MSHVVQRILQPSLQAQTHETGFRFQLRLPLQPFFCCSGSDHAAGTPRINSISASTSQAEWCSLKYPSSPRRNWCTRRRKSPMYSISALPVLSAVSLRRVVSSLSLWLHGAIALQVELRTHFEELLSGLKLLRLCIPTTSDLIGHDSVKRIKWCRGKSGLSGSWP